MANRSSPRKKSIRFKNRGASPLSPATPVGEQLALALAQELQKSTIESMERLGVSRAAQLKSYRQALKKGKKRKGPSAEFMARIAGIANVLAGWRRDPGYLLPNGTPRVIPIHGRGASFASLAKKYIPGVSVEDVLEAITRHGEAKVYQGHKVALMGTSALVVPKTRETMLALLVNRVNRVSRTVLHNASLPEGSKGLGRFERHVFGVLSEREFKQYARALRAPLQAICDRAEAGLELAAGKKGRNRKACGIGIFVFRDD
jgi:hypothetical protein